MFPGQQCLASLIHSFLASLPAQHNTKKCTYTVCALQPHTHAHTPMGVPPEGQAHSNRAFHVCVSARACVHTKGLSAQLCMSAIASIWVGYIGSIYTMLHGKSLGIG